MATIQATVVQTGNPDASKTYTLADADMDRAIASYQKAANTFFGVQVATRNQVLLYMFDKLIKQSIQRAVSVNEIVPQFIPPPIVIT